MVVSFGTTGSRLVALFGWIVTTTPFTVLANKNTNDIIPTAHHVQCHSTVFEGGFSHKINDHFFLHWIPQDKNDAENIEQTLLDSFHGALVYTNNKSNNNNNNNQHQHEDGMWLGVGFSKDGKMTGSRAIVGTPYKPPQLWDLLSNQQKIHTTHQDDLTTKLAGIAELVGNQTHDQFQVGGHIVETAHFDSLEVGQVPFYTSTFKFHINRHFESQLSQPDEDGYHTFLYAAGKSSSFGYHGPHAHRGAIRIKLNHCGHIIDTPQSTETASTAGNYNHKAAFIAHGFFATLAFAVCLPMGLGIAWFRTLTPRWWIYIHVACQCLTFFFALISILTGFTGMVIRNNSVSSEQIPSKHMSHGHHWLGFFLFVMVIVQVALGFGRPATDPSPSDGNKTSGSKNKSKNSSHETDEETEDTDRPIMVVPPTSPRTLCGGRIKLPSTQREKWRLLHRVVAFVLVIMALAQITTGINLYSKEYNNSDTTARFVFLIWVMVILSGMIVVKFYVIRRNKAKKKRQQAKHAVSSKTKTLRQLEANPHSNIMPQMRNEAEEEVYGDDMDGIIDVTMDDDDISGGICAFPRMGLNPANVIGQFEADSSDDDEKEQSAEII